MRHAFTVAVLVAAFGVLADGQAGDTPESHIATAKAAARDDLTGLFDRTCGSLNPPAAAGRDAAAGGAQATLARVNWHDVPVEVLDILDFVCKTEFSAW